MLQPDINKKGVFSSDAYFLILIPLFVVGWVMIFISDMVWPAYLILGVLGGIVYVSAIWARLYNGLLLIAFAAPLSLKTPLPIFQDHNIIFPGELMACIFMFILGTLMVFSYHSYKHILLHPLSIVVLFYLVVKLTTGMLSEMLLVSAKSVFISFLYIAVFFYGAAIMFREWPQSIPKYFWLYTAGTIIVIGYTIWNFAQMEFIQGLAAWAPQPLMNDHTQFAAVLSMLLPFSAGYLLIKSKNNRTQNILLLLVTFILFVGLITTTSRAGWLSFMGGLFVFALIYAGVRFYHIVIFLSLLSILVYARLEPIKDYFAMYDKQSVETIADIQGQLETVIDLTGNVSNLERLNRWEAAMNMYQDKKLTGFGPGTYQFQFVPYQNPDRMTVISVTGPGPYTQGFGGTTHSEYLLALSESGIFGFLSVILLYAVAFRTGINAFHNLSGNDKILVAIAVTGLTTYFIHAVFNNFLDTLEAASLFWPLMALILTMDLKRLKKSSDLHW